MEAIYDSQFGPPLPAQAWCPPSSGVVDVPPTRTAGYPPTDPAASQWISCPPNCTPGLEYLSMIDQLLVQQNVEILEALVGFETNNKYEVKNSMGQRVYYAAEDTHCCTRYWCGPIRPFNMKILDNSGREVIHLYRPLRCDSCCYPCCLQEMVVTASGSTIGFVKQEWSICIPKYRVENAARECVLRIEGPFCQCNIFGDVEYKVLSRDGSKEVGKISKQWAGLVKEILTDADTFGITFPMNLDVNIKAVLLGTCFLIDFMFFEHNPN
ncbi:phospholipid scramblase 2-like [Tachypleus tridentatus]|uniref:phospholipid scramblase 2-like n=1 Tax=Tachypleus tridentatus TaxID=6853 RepID=UPI003FD283CE